MNGLSLSQVSHYIMLFSEIHPLSSFCLTMVFSSKWNQVLPYSFLPSLLLLLSSIHWFVFSFEGTHFSFVHGFFFFLSVHSMIALYFLSYRSKAFCLLVQFSISEFAHLLLEKACVRDQQVFHSIQFLLGRPTDSLQTPMFFLFGTGYYPGGKSI